MTGRAVIVVLVCLIVGAGCASSDEQKRFKSPQAAVDSMIAAVRAKDTKQLKKIFGPGSDAVLASGDPVSDQAQASKFLSAYDQRHRVQSDVNGNATLLVGDQDWPFPVPIVQVDDRYLFDTPAGEDEILNRRIGRNELETQQVCLAIVDAQREYAQRRPMGGDVPQYAQKLVSDPGTKNGLFWPTAEGEPLSPLGVLAAEASQEGYTAGQGAGRRVPYHGYYYRLLTSQGAHASGGATEYLLNGKLIGGFAVVAFPAQYGNSGIMTFMTNHDGVVYQRDLGPDTAQIARSMASFDPGPEWKPISPPPAGP